MKFETKLINNLAQNSEYIGDDCAVIDHLLLSTDSLVEHIHFNLEYSTPWQTGYKTAAVNISDIAGMGGIPEYFLLSLSLPKNKTDFADEFFQGLLTCLENYKVKLIGGDTTGSKTDIFINGTIIGRVHNAPVYRNTANPGEKIYLTGIPGLSAAGLSLLETHRKDLWPEAVRHHLLPEPDVKNGLSITTHGLATSMMDLSDGISKDLKTICNQSSTGAVIYKNKIPLATNSPFDENQLLQYAIHGGEDYCLLFTSSDDYETLQRHICPLYCIGEITEGSLMILSDNGKENPIDDLTFDHF